jgi:Trypsin
MRRHWKVAVVVCGLCVAAIPASAVIWGEPDGDAHPYVGLAVFDRDGLPSHRCSGTLLSPTVFLTAGHCTDGTSGARVWFDSSVTDPQFPLSGGGAIEGTPYTHPLLFVEAFPNTRDVGIVVLSAPVLLPEYGQLPALGALDEMVTRRGLQDQLFTIVGYGRQAIVPVFINDRERFTGTPMLVELNSAKTGGFYIHLSSNNGDKAPGGICFADSGAPALIGNSSVVAGIGSFLLNGNCVGGGFSYRLDTADARDFIEGFLQ